MASSQYVLGLELGSKFLEEMTIVALIRVLPISGMWMPDLHPFCANTVAYGLWQYIMLGLLIIVRFEMYDSCVKQDPCSVYNHHRSIHLWGQLASPLWQCVPFVYQGIVFGDVAQNVGYAASHNILAELQGRHDHGQSIKHYNSITVLQISPREKIGILLLLLVRGSFSSNREKTRSQRGKLRAGWSLHLLAGSDGALRMLFTLRDAASLTAMNQRSIEVDHPHVHGYHGDLRARPPLPTSAPHQFNHMSKEYRQQGNERRGEEGIHAIHVQSTGACP
ncbi:hypothetical protein VNO77_23004 [Canavalia gladiata]|uniref:Uncharacterized protein n=1 Tax=Canavalia gladiata TaxID=3824 RepID=A0AAN9L3N8_CANGL